MKVLLVLVDGMRPDALEGIPEMEALKKTASYSFKGKTVFPSYTLPCHMSLFHSVDPARHGTTTNTFAPQVRPIEGLCEVIRKKRLHIAFFYSWEQLRDVSRPDSMTTSLYLNGHYDTPYSQIQQRIAAAALRHLQEERMEFVFCYLGWPDDAGHRYGWMSPEYRHSVEESWKQIARLAEAAGEEYTLIVTADHGGHDRMHGTELPEDTTIPVFFRGPHFPQDKELDSFHITDIAPTVAGLMGLTCPEEWEGRSLV